MKILRNKTYKILLNDLEHKEKSITDQHKMIMQLEEDLKGAKDLKLILDKFYPIYTSDSFSIRGSSVELILPENVLVHSDDILGGKVIKQEANKCLVIDKEGNVKTGLTKQKVDTGYTYKLVRN